MCGFAAHLPFRRNGKTKPKVLSAADPPPDEFPPKPTDFPPLIIDRLPETEKLIKRQSVFPIHHGNDATLIRIIIPFFPLFFNRIVSDESGS